MTEDTYNRCMWSGHKMVRCWANIVQEAGEYFWSRVWVVGRFMVKTVRYVNGERTCCTDEPSASITATLKLRKRVVCVWSRVCRMRLLPERPGRNLGCLVAQNSKRQNKESTKQTYFCSFSDVISVFLIKTIKELKLLWTSFYFIIWPEKKQKPNRFLPSNHVSAATVSLIKSQHLNRRVPFSASTRRVKKESRAAAGAAGPSSLLSSQIVFYSICSLWMADMMDTVIILM